MTDYFKYTARTLTEEESNELINKLFDDKCELAKEKNMLKKELENIKVAFKMEQDNNILRRDSLNRLCDKYRELEKEHEDLQKRHEACESVWVKCEERNDELKRTLEAKNEQIKELQAANWRQSDEIVEQHKQINLLVKNIQEKDAEIERLHKKKNDQRAHLNAVQQALLDRNMKIEALNGEVDRLKIEVKERRVVFEPTYYLRDIQARDEEIKTLRKKNLDLKNENEGWKLKYDHLNADLTNKVLDNIELNEQIEKDIQDYNKLFHEKEKLEKELETAKERDTDIHINKLYLQYFTPPTQPINIENLNVTYYENGPVWTNDDDSGEEETADIFNTLKEDE